MCHMNSRRGGGCMVQCREGPGALLLLDLYKCQCHGPCHVLTKYTGGCCASVELSWGGTEGAVTSSALQAVPSKSLSPRSVSISLRPTFKIYFPFQNPLGNSFTFSVSYVGPPRKNLAHSARYSKHKGVTAFLSNGSF